MFHERRWSRAAAALSLPPLPGRVVILSGGYVAFEFAGVDAMLGIHPTVAEEFVSLRPPES